jgi:GNAT superfamily N-acetyltransferase
MAQDEFRDAFVGWFGDHEQSHSAFVAELDDAGIGMAWLATVERVPGPGKWTRLAANLQSVYVLPAHRGHGVGAALVTAALEDATGRGFDYISVHPSERSFPLYRRLGFRETDGVLELDLRSRR